MSICICYGNRELVPVYPQNRTRFSRNRKSVVQLRIVDAMKWNISEFSCSISIPKRPSEFFVGAASSSAPLGGFSETWQGARPDQKTRKVAGIDQEEIEDPTLLADPDSCFCEFNGVQLHHKLCDAEILAPDALQEGSASQSSNPTRRINFPMILLHGFGASLFSWNRVMKPLARATSSKVLAFDRPAFGLTSRVDVINHSSVGKNDSRPLNPYSMVFSVMATLHLVDLLGAEKAILMGHSAGAFVAVEAYFRSPESVAALILVAPAIFAPLSWKKNFKGDKARIDNKMQENSSESNISGNLFFRLCNILSKITTFIAIAIVNMVKGMANVINSLYRKVLAVILRSAVGVVLIRLLIDRFGIPAVRSAWYDSSQVSDHVLQGYTKPLKVKGWDKALLEFTVAILTDSKSESEQPLSERLSEISCPVLIVTGDTDRIVPAWNAERLSRAIPGASFEIIKKCGHVPQEEKPEEFVSIVDKFLQGVFGVAENAHLQPAT